MSNSSTLPLDSLLPLQIESSVLQLLRDSMTALWRYISLELLGRLAKEAKPTYNT
jgi:hypothetical protein